MLVSSTDLNIKSELYAMAILCYGGSAFEQYFQENIVLMTFFYV